MQSLFYFLTHIDSLIIQTVTAYGHLSYLILFAVIFCETGLIVTPFLPGDSLLFTLGGLAAQPDNTLNISKLFLLLLIASILGNQFNYIIGKWVGRRLLQSKTRLINPNYLIKAHQFYDHHGKITLVLARFMPIIRTCIPFIAGISRMNPTLFLVYNVIGAVCWIGGLLSTGYFFAYLPVFRNHFIVVIYGIIFLSLLPFILGLLKTIGYKLTR